MSIIEKVLLPKLKIWDLAMTCFLEPMPELLKPLAETMLLWENFGSTITDIEPLLPSTEGKLFKDTPIWDLYRTLHTNSFKHAQKTTTITSNQDENLYQAYGNLTHIFVRDTAKKYGWIETKPEEEVKSIESLDFGSLEYQEVLENVLIIPFIDFYIESNVDKKVIEAILKHKHGDCIKAFNHLAVSYGKLYEIKLNEARIVEYEKYL